MDSNEYEFKITKFVDPILAFDPTEIYIDNELVWKKYVLSSSSVLDGTMTIEECTELFRDNLYDFCHIFTLDIIVDTYAEVELRDGRRRLIEITTKGK